MPVEPLRFPSPPKVRPESLRAVTSMMDEIRTAMRVAARAANAASPAMRALGRALHPPPQWHGVPVQRSPHVLDGQVLVAGTPPTVILVGTHRPDASEHGDDARMIVRRGMADVLDWLGEDVEQLSAGERLIDRLHAGTVDRLFP